MARSASLAVDVGIVQLIGGQKRQMPVETSQNYPMEHTALQVRVVIVAGIVQLGGMEKWHISVETSQDGAMEQPAVQVRVVMLARMDIAIGGERV